MGGKKLIPVWDILVRIFHWSLVLAFSIAYLTEDEFEEFHVDAGYVVLGLISFRVLWGFIGSRYARFSDFIYPPSEVKAYLSSLLTKNPKHYLGHNPAGGVMVVALLISLFAATLSGVKIYGVQGYGPLAQNIFEDGYGISIISEAHAHGDNKHEDDKDRFKKEESEEEEFWEEIHEFFSNFTLLLIFIHITGVVVASRVHGENLVRAMITGKKEE